MVTRFQRRRSHVQQDRSSVDLYSELLKGLDDDERLIFPEMYMSNQDMYDKVSGFVYLIKGPDGELDWVWEHTLSKRLSEYVDHGFRILLKQLIVRLRLPWAMTDTEWLCSQEELEEHRDEYDVIKTYIYGYDLENPKHVQYIHPIDYEEDRERYEIVEIKYNVTWKMSDQTKEHLLGYNPKFIPYLG